MPACSPVLRDLLVDNSHNHPLIYLRGIKQRGKRLRYSKNVSQGDKLVELSNTKEKHQSKKQ